MVAAVLLAATVWHWWIAVVLAPITILVVLATVGGYVAKVTASRYPRKH